MIQVAYHAATSTECLRCIVIVVVECTRHHVLTEWALIYLLCLPSWKSQARYWERIRCLCWRLELTHSLSPPWHR
jgi:hypothetical protein